MKHSRLHRWITVAGFVLSLLGGARYAIALHTQSPPVTQVTSQTSGTIGKSAVWGDVTWAFQASGDSLGTGNATTELFTYEHDLRMLGGAFGLTQVTCGGFLPDNPSVSTPSFGDALAFDAIGTLCADGRNNCVAPFDAISTARQIYLYTPNTGQIRQLTHCAGDCANPGLSQNARMIVFESTADVLGVNGGAPLPKMHVYQGNLRQLGPGCPMLPCAPGRADRGVTNLTFPYGGRNASQNFTGKYVAYESDGDPLNNGALSGVPHVYVLNVRQRLLEQVPQAGSAIPARKPSLDQGGRRLVYEADVQRPGPSPAVVTEIFASRLRHNRVPLTISLTPNADANSYDPVMGPTGRRATFTSEADLLGRGSTGKQIFGYAFVGTPAFNVRHLLQVTGGPAGSERSVQSAFLFAGFASSDDFVANGNATPQFFVANLYKRAPGSVLSPLPGTPTARPSTTPRPTATPIAGVPDTIGMALVTNQAIDNHDNTLTTIIAATVRDYFGNPVADGTAVHFGVPATASGIVVGNGFTNADPDRDVTSFAQQTGIQIENRPGVAHVCVTYPGALSTTSHTIIAAAGPQRCVGGGTPWAACANDGDCSAKHACSVHTQTACDPFGGNVDCPAGETCEREDGRCEHAAYGEGPLSLPSAVNACANNGDPCSDGNPCTLNDKCGGGTNTCVGGGNAGLSCTQDAHCATPTGGYCQRPTCQSGTAKICPTDASLCTDDTCNVFTGQCGTPVTCEDDHNPCTDDVCDPGTGTCGIANVAPCDDHDACTVGDECQGGTCHVGTPLSCPDDGNVCTLDICNPHDGTCGVRFDPCACSAP